MYSGDFWVLGAGFEGCFFDDFRVAVGDEGADEGVGEVAEEVELVPVFFVHVPCGFDFVVAVAQVEGVVGVAFDDEPFGVVEVEHGEYFAENSKDEDGVAEGEVFGGKGEREAVVSEGFNVHW